MKHLLLHVYKEALPAGDEKRPAGHRAAPTFAVGRDSKAEPVARELSGFSTHAAATRAMCAYHAEKSAADTPVEIAALGLPAGDLKKEKPTTKGRRAADTTTGGSGNGN